MCGGVEILCEQERRWMEGEVCAGIGGPFKWSGGYIDIVLRSAAMCQVGKTFLEKFLPGLEMCETLLHIAM
jgi:hypothetical protein